MCNYIIETEKVALRELTYNDFQNLYDILGDVETMKYYPKPFDQDKTRNWIQRNIDNYKNYSFGLWAVILKETGEFVGECGVTMQNIFKDGNLLPEVGFHINKKYWQKGYASYAAKACLEYMFKNTEFNEIYCYQKWTNIPSRRSAEKLGMSLRKEFDDKINTKTSVYSITRAEFEGKKVPVNSDKFKDYIINNHLFDVTKQKLMFYLKSMWDEDKNEFMNSFNNNVDTVISKYKFENNGVSISKCFQYNPPLDYISVWINIYDESDSYVCEYTAFYDYELNCFDDKLSE